MVIAEGVSFKSLGSSPVGGGTESHKLRSPRPMTEQAAGTSGVRVLLRDVTGADLPVFFEQQLDPEATHMAAFPARDRDAFMAHWTKILTNESVVTRAITVNGEVV